MQGDSTLYFKNEMEKNPINQTQAGCFVDAIKNKTLYERPHHNRVLDIFDIKFVKIFLKCVSMYRCQLLEC